MNICFHLIVFSGTLAVFCASKMVVPLDIQKFPIISFYPLSNATTSLKPEEKKPNKSGDYTTNSMKFKIWLLALSLILGVSCLSRDL